MTSSWPSCGASDYAALNRSHRQGSAEFRSRLGISVTRRSRTSTGPRETSSWRSGLPATFHLLPPRSTHTPATRISTRASELCDAEIRYHLQAWWVPRTRATSSPVPVPPAPIPLKVAALQERWIRPFPLSWPMQRLPRLVRQIALNPVSTSYPASYGRGTESESFSTLSIFDRRGRPSTNF